MQNNPYVGPRPFELQHRRSFFGRDEEIHILAGLTRARRIVVFYAQSGAGKSSLVRAGLIPELTQTDTSSGMQVLPIVYAGRGREDLPAANIYTQSVVLGLGSDLAPEPLGACTIAEALAPLLERGASPDDDRPALLIIDQFEEIATRHRARWEERAGFFKQVAAALAEHDDLHVLLVMREDYIAELVPFAHLLPDQLRTRYRMERLKCAAAVAAISLPAAMNGCPFEPGVAESLADDLRRSRSGAGRDEKSEHVEPVQLQIVCLQLWDQLAAGSTSIGREHLEKHADVGRALIAFYSGVVARISRVAQVSERQLRRFFAESLITPSRTRGLVYRGEKTTAGLPNAVIDLINDEYIIRGEDRGGDRWYELSHDRLLEPIQTANDAWHQEYEQQVPLIRAARAWSGGGRAAHLLLGGEALREVEAWVRDNPGDPLTSQEQEFLTASRAQQSANEERRVERRIHLEDLGWGVIFPAVSDRVEDAAKADAIEAIREALGELLVHRRKEAGRKNPKHYREFTDLGGYRPGEDAQSFLRRHGASFSTAGPDRMPHYLLIVGDPETIPFEFQYGLAARCSVGRIHFEVLEQYATYARSVVEAESGKFALHRHAAIFNGVAGEEPMANVTREFLIRPLLAQLSRSASLAQEWTVTREEPSTRREVQDLYGGSTTPALLFSASHSLSFPAGHERQLADQGALWFGDRSAPPVKGRPSPEVCLTADDVADDARLLGTIVCLFAPYGVGTPRFDNFSRQRGKAEAPQIAPGAFISRLCQRLLGHPGGGVLAMIGHVDNLWDSSFRDGRSDSNDGAQIFFHVLDRLMRGHTVGSAMGVLGTRYAQLASALVDDLLQGDSADPRRRYEQVKNITRAIDARNYIVLGDPAARLPLEGTLVDERPVIAPIDPLADVVTRSAAPDRNTLLVFNGVDGTAGRYAFEAMRLERVVEHVRGETEGLDEMREITEWSRVEF